MRFKTLISASLFVLSLVSPMAAMAKSAINRHKTRLVVNVVVSQMRYDYLLRFADNFGEKGFHTLVREGSLCTRATYDYALTCTGAGLATITTGANPSIHGVIGKRWWNYTTGEMIELGVDRGVFTTGSDDYDGQFSPRGLIASTVGDQLKAISKDSKVISVAFDPVSSVVMGGYSADASYWLNARDGKFVTSSYYMNALPLWVNKFNEAGHTENLSSEIWMISKPLGEYHNGEYRDIAVEKGQGISYDLVMRKKYDYDRLAASPAANTLVKSFAEQAIIYEGLGNDDSPDVLNVVFDATRHIGERYGTESVEVEDAYYRLDEDLGEFLEFLQTQVGKDHLLVVLTSDHGASDPYRADAVMPGGYFNGNQFAALVSGFLSAQLGPQQNWLLSCENRQIYLNRTLIYQKGHNLENIQMQLANFAVQFSGVSQAVTATALQTGHFTSGVMGRMQNSYFPKNSGDVIINLMPGWIEFEEGKLSDSGSPYNYDTHVPLLWYGGMITNEDVIRDVNMTDVAPTVADILGIALPQAATGTPIREVMNK